MSRRPCWSGSQSSSPVSTLVRRRTVPSFRRTCGTETPIRAAAIWASHYGRLTRVFASPPDQGGDGSGACERHAKRSVGCIRAVVVSCAGPEDACSPCGAGRPNRNAGPTLITWRRSGPGFRLLSRSRAKPTPAEERLFREFEASQGDRSPIAKIGGRSTTRAGRSWTMRRFSAIFRNRRDAEARL
jgi:hypothetical protein